MLAGKSRINLPTTRADRPGSGCLAADIPLKNSFAPVFIPLIFRPIQKKFAESKGKNLNEETENQAKPVEAAAPAQAQAPNPAQGEDRRRPGSRRPRFRRDGRGDRGDRGNRGGGGEQRDHGDRGGPQQRPAETQKRSSPSIRKAIQQVDQIRVELKRILDEMNEVIRTLDQIEREKSATEEEIDMLRESLRLLHREPSSYPRPQRGPEPREKREYREPRRDLPAAPAPAPATSPVDPDLPEDDDEL
jgi:hypothetical protein